MYGWPGWATSGIRVPMAYIVMAYIVMATSGIRVPMAYIVMAYIVMTTSGIRVPMDERLQRRFLAHRQQKKKQAAGAPCLL